MLVVARVAAADDTALPGTFSDPAHALELNPAIELVPVDGVADGFAIRDADPGRVKLYVDGFEVPALLAHGRAGWFGSMSHVRTSEDGMDLAYGGATGGMIEVLSAPAYGHGTAELTPMDLSLSAGGRMLGGVDNVAIRFGFERPTANPSLELEATSSVLAQGRIDWRLSSRWTLGVRVLEMIEGDRGFARTTGVARYRAGGTRADIALSGGYSDHLRSIDTRAEIAHELRDVGGLSAVEVRGGANGSLVDEGENRIGPVVFSGGAFSMISGAIDKRMVFAGGVRADIFEHHAALSPRGTLGLIFGDNGVGVTAMAYRQAQADATPERATQVELKVTHHMRAGRIEAAAYYIDRSRILVEGRATGVGTAAGVELREYLTQGAWTYYFAGAFGHATRADRLTAPDHPADLDVPVKLDVLASWVSGGWRLGARVRVSSGLPYTPVTGAIYDGDTDTYAPIYGKVNSERAPWRRELDLRVDRRLLPRLRAYLDVRIDGGVLGYTYSYDDSERLAIRAPVVMPWLGIVGDL